MTEMMQTNKQDIMNKIKSGSWTFIKVSSWAVWLLVKILFWFNFGLFFLMQSFLCLMMYDRVPNQIAEVELVLFLHISLTIGFLISLIMRQKVFIYIFAWIIFLLFFYVAPLPNLDPYYGYFNTLD